MKADKVKARMMQMVDEQIVPGVSYAHLHDGQVETMVYGNAALVPQVQPLRWGMLYDMASLTKVVGTTTVILKMIEQGMITLDDRVADHIPLFKDQRVTVRHLLTHTSAISGYIPHRNQLPPDRLLAALDSLSVGDWFDQKVVYTDVGLIMLGQIIEKFYQAPVQTVIQNEVLIPLGLTESTFDPIKENCVPTEMTASRGLIQGAVHDPKAFILKEHCGSAGLFMPLNDLIKFAQWILGITENDLLQRSTLDSLFKDWTTHHLGRSLGWDLRISPDQTPWIYHTGYTGTYILLSKARQEGLIVLTNRVHPTADNQAFLDFRDQLVADFIK